MKRKNPIPSMKRTILPDWPWTNPTYSLNLSRPKSEIKAIGIDITNTMADINPNNNSFSE